VENGFEVRTLEVRYAGVTVGRSTRVRDWSASGAFVGFAEPLPSGTALVLKGDGVEQAARVVGVVESADPGVAGMQVTFVAAEAARPAAKPAAPAPAPAAVAEAAPAAPAAVAEAAPAAPAAVAEAAPDEVSSGTSSAAVASEISGPASAEPGPGETGDSAPQGQGGGKRRRRRR